MEVKESIDYNREFKRYSSKWGVDSPIHEHLNPYLENVNDAQFTTRTGLSPATYYRLKRDSKYRFNTSLLVTVCIALKIDFEKALQILRINNGETFPYGKVEMAYCYLLENHSGKNLQECNEILKKLEIDEKYFLGDKSLPENRAF